MLNTASHSQVFEVVDWKVDKYIYIYIYIVGHYLLGYFENSWSTFNLARSSQRTNTTYMNNNKKVGELTRTQLNIYTWGSIMGD